MSLIKFMSSRAGRLLRVVAGIALIAVGLLLGGGWLTLSVIGLVPLIAGALNVCLLAPLMSQPLKSR
ncbi:MAG TPA: YgaP-like transmembrane domain [Acidimicrobiales bacterium]|nr:YgaP-like transmembrane domain [Acidimicrobiales bacterium]